MTDYIKQHSSTLEFLSGNSWVILNPVERRIKEKIELVGKPLKDWDISINYGIKTGCNEAFIIDKAKRDELIKKDKKSVEIIRPILRGRDIKRYGYDYAEKYIIATFPSRKYDIDDFPAIRDYLLKYGKQRLEQSGEPGARKKTSHKWFETQDPIAYWDDFSKQKIIFQEMVQESSFMYDKKGMFYCLDTCRIITGNNIDYLIGILNSKLFFFAVKYFYGGGALGADGVRMKHTFFENFSCTICNENQKQIILTLVNKRLSSKDNEYSKTVEYEIDQEVYSLYGLSKEEVKFIESL